MRGVVGVFDSGVGGLSVLKECVRLLPGARYIYYADTAACPYGNKPVPEITRLSLAAADRLTELGAEVIVAACNTATSAAADTLRALGKEIIGVEPAVKPAAGLLKEGERALVLATDATIKQEKLNQLIDRLGRHKFLLSAQRSLAAVIEDNIFNLSAAEFYIDKVLAPYKDDLSITAVVLGCTHYIFIKDIIGRLMPHAQILDGNIGVAKNLYNHTVQIWGADFDGLEGGGKTDITFINNGGANAKDYWAVWRQIVCNRAVINVN